MTTSKFGRGPALADSSTRASQIQADIDLLKTFSKHGVKAEAMSDTHLQWRLFRQGYAPCFISLTTGAVTQHGRRAEAVGLTEALALLGVVL